MVEVTWWRILLVVMVMSAGCSVRPPGDVESHTPGGTPQVSRVSEPNDAVVTPTPPSRGPREDIDVARLQRLLLAELNEFRAPRASPVLEDPRLSLVARNKSHHMATEGYFGHEGPDGKDVSDRLNEAEFSCLKETDTLLRTYWKTPIRGLSGGTLTNESSLAEYVVASFANSPPNREILVDSAYDIVGIGVYVTENGTVYVTFLFCNEP